MVRTAVLTATAAAVLTAAGAHAAEPDPFELFLDGLAGGLEAQTTPRVCPELSGGTAGMPEPSRRPAQPDSGNGLGPGVQTSAPGSLPERVALRTTKTTFNRRYWFALHEGRIWFRSNQEVTGIAQPWARLPTPACFDGRVSGIAADDDELVALALGRRVFTMDAALGDPAEFNWTVRWGPPFWTGAGRRVPRGRDWDWSVSSPREDGTFSDDAGNEHAFGEGKVSHIWLLNRRGRRLTYLDPWLASDQSYEMCGPRRGRFRSAALAASGSTVFIVNRFGDMYTRLYDFDISGADSVFFDYSYEDQRGRPNPAIQLPSPAWVKQPKVPGRITSAISIHKLGRGSTDRTLRAEGRHRGRNGYWEKEIGERGGGDWSFVATGEALQGRFLRNPPRDTSRRDLARRSADRRYVSRTLGRRAVIANFHVFCSPARLRIRLEGGERIELRLHTVDAIRLAARARGLDDEPRIVQGTLEAPGSVLGSEDPAVAAFAERYLDGRFTAARIEATRSELVFPDQGWRFAHRQRCRQTDAPPCGAPGTTAASAGAREPRAATEDLSQGLIPRELAGQRLIAGWEGLNPPSGLERLIARGRVAGVILFADNIGSRRALRRTIRRLQRIPRPEGLRDPLLVMVDQEGGQVKRLSGPPTASASEMGRRGTTYSRRQGRRTGRSLAGLGINVDLAPVLDVARPGGEIDRTDRAFGRRPGRVIRAGVDGFARGLAARRVVPTAKHFPGIGTIDVNTDFAAQRVTTSKRTLRRVDERPFAAFAGKPRRIVMLSLATYTAFANRPAAFAKQIVGGELRRRLGFDGVTITDSLGTAAARAFGPEDRVALAAAGAGNDLLLYSDWRQAKRMGETLADAIRSGRIPREEAQRSVRRSLGLRAGLRDGTDGP